MKTCSSVCVVLSLWSWEVCLYVTVLTSCTAKPMGCLCYWSDFGHCGLQEATALFPDLENQLEDPKGGMRKISRNVWWLDSKEENAVLSLIQVHMQKPVFLSQRSFWQVLLLKKISIWMLKLSVHWVVYKARLHEKHRVQDEVYKYIMS